MNDHADRLLVDWLSDGPDRGPQHGLERALAAIRRTPQRPGWTFPERWIPMQLTMRPAYASRPLFLALAVSLLLVALLAGLLLVGSQRPLPPLTGPAGNGRIAFDSDGTIYLTNPDGSAPTALPVGLAESASPAFSPDGTLLAFLSKEAGRAPYRLFVAKADGTAARNLTGDLPIVTEPFSAASWSPDSTRLTFHSRSNGRDIVYVVNVDGTGLEAITDDVVDRAGPSWSPTGDWILFRRQPFTTDVPASELDLPALGIIRPDGSDERALVTLDYRSSTAFSSSQWSPTGDRIAYWAGREGAHDLFVVDLTGNVTTVSDRPESEFNVAWSPDGRRLAFFGEESGLIVASADGSEREVLGPIADCGVVFSPDGTALIGYTPGDCQGLLVIPLDGAGAPRPIAGASAVVGTPGWQRLAP